MKGKEEQGKLKKNMRPIDVFSLALGAIIGWGCFVLPGNSFLPKAGPLGTALGMLIGAVIIIIIALSYGYLIRKFPVSGGEFVYTKATMGKTNAFICGWGMILAYWSLVPLNATALGLIARYVSVDLFPNFFQAGGALYEVAGWEVYAGEVALASVFIILMAIINIVGIKQAAWMQTAIAMTLVGGIFLVTALVFAQGPEFSNLAPGFPEMTPIGKESNWWVAIFSIVAMAPWAFIGFDCIPQSAEEYNFNHKKSTGIMIIAILLAALMYIAINTVTAVWMPWEDLLAGHHSWPTGFIVKSALGNIGLLFLGIAMFCAVVSGMNAFYIATSRLMYAMAKEGALPRTFAKLTEKSSTPKNAILFVMVLALIAPWFGREVLGWIVDMTSVGAAVVFAYTTASAAILAYRHKHKMQVFVGVLGFLFSIFFLTLLLVPGMPGYLSEQSQVALVAWVVLGIIFYFMRRRTYYKVSDDNETKEIE